MKTELEKTRLAIAGGRSDEALVHAWNALASIGPDEAPELARLAGELGDPQLLREIERRGFSVQAAAAPEPETAERKPVLRRVLRAVPPLAVVLIIASAAGTFVPTESGERHPTPEELATEAEVPAPPLAVRTGVWLVPLGPAGSVNVPRLAGELSVRYHLPVRVLPGIALPRWTLDENERALVAEQLIRLLRQRYRAEERAVVVGITDYDMNSRTEKLAHTFSWRAPPHYGVVSTSTLAAALFARLRGHSRHERTRKLVARNIGFLYYRSPEVDDPHSLLRPAMHAVDDIDELEENLRSG